jgi:hypothetical protein
MRLSIAVCREAKQVEFAHRHVVDRSVARQHDIAEDGRQFTARPHLSSQNTPSAPVPGSHEKLADIAAGSSCSTTSPLATCLKCAVDPLKVAVSVCKSTGVDLVGVLAAAAVSMREVAPRELLDEDLVGSHFRDTELRNAPVRNTPSTSASMLGTTPFGPR